MGRQCFACHKMNSIINVAAKQEHWIRSMIYWHQKLSYLYILSDDYLDLFVIVNIDNCWFLFFLFLRYEKLEIIKSQKRVNNCPELLCYIDGYKQRHLYINVSNKSWTCSSYVHRFHVLHTPYQFHAYIKLPNHRQKASSNQQNGLQYCISASIYIIARNKPAFDANYFHN